MPLLWYAETPARRIRQFVADLAAILALVGCYWLGSAVLGLTAELAGPGRSLESGGAALAQRMTEAGAAVSGAPFIGDTLRQPFDEASAAARSIKRAGVQQQHVVGTLSTTLGWVTGGVPAIVVLAVWLPRRLQFARRAGQAHHLVRSGVGVDVFALRALARQPIAKLAKLPTDPAAGWRAGDPATIEALAALELRREGLRARSMRNSEMSADT